MSSIQTVFMAPLTVYLCKHGAWHSQTTTCSSCLDVSMYGWWVTVCLCSWCKMMHVQSLSTTIHSTRLRSQVQSHFMVAGYACHRYNLKLRLFKPRSASALQTFISWMTGMPAEFSDPRFPSYGEGREGKNADAYSHFNSEIDNALCWACRDAEAWLQLHDAHIICTGSAWRFMFKHSACWRLVAASSYRLTSESCMIWWTQLGILAWSSASCIQHRVQAFLPLLMTRSFCNAVTRVESGGHVQVQLNVLTKVSMKAQSHSNSPKIACLLNCLICSEQPRMHVFKTIGAVGILVDWILLFLQDMDMFGYVDGSSKDRSATTIKQM